MHIASKITLILGALIFVGSIAGVVIAGMALTDADYKEEVYVDRSMSQTFTVQENKSWDVSIYVIHPADCDTLELSIVDSDGEEVAPVLCLLDGGQGNEEFYPDGSEEFYGSLNHDIEGMEYTLESNVEVSIRGDYCDQACEEAIGGGIVAGAGGFFGFCCSVPLLVLGIILALVLDDPKQNIVMPTGQMPTGQAIYQAPVQTQVPVGQNIQQGYGQPMQQMGGQQQPITPPLTQQAQQPQITPPLTQQPQQAQITPPISEQPAQSPWDNL
ncbi:hypothetical protein N9X98_01285 [Candidatus Poseidoniales archaeon]|nr:hypothetical protein [Candidatus Poseidoniales archaeon]